MSSSGDSVGLLNRTICATVVVINWCITELAHSWWVSIQSIIIQSNFFFLFIAGREPTTWHKGSRCLQIMVCSCAMPSNCVWLKCLDTNYILLIRTKNKLFSFLRSLLRENGTSLGFLRIFIVKQTWWSNVKQLLKSIIAKYRDLSFSLRSIIASADLLATDKLRYLANRSAVRFGGDQLLCCVWLLSCN